MVICLEQGVDMHMAQLMPLSPTVSCFSKIQIGLPFWYRLTRVVPDKGPLNGCVGACVFCQTNLNTYRTDLHQICRVGRTTAVYQRSEVSFSTPQGTLPWQPIFVGFIGFYPQNSVQVASGFVIIIRMHDSPDFHCYF